MCAGLRRANRVIAVVWARVPRLTIPLTCTRLRSGKRRSSAGDQRWGCAVRVSPSRFPAWEAPLFADSCIPVSGRGPRVWKLAVTTFTAILLITVALIDKGTEAQSVEEGATLEVRVIARPNEDGSVEFAVEYDNERYLPDGRRLTRELADRRRGQWLTSTPVEIVGPPSQPAVLLGGGQYRDNEDFWDAPGFGRSVEVVRVRARPLEDRRVEFALIHNGESYLPSTRYLTPRLVEERIGTWLRSSPIEIPTQTVPAEHVRQHSTSWYNARTGTERVSRSAPSVDIARICTLRTLTTVPREVAAEAWFRFRNAHAYSSAPVELTDLYPSLQYIVDFHWLHWQDYYGNVALWASEPPRIHEDYGVADYYGVMIEHVRHGRAAIWWMAEFACAEDAPTGNIERSDGTGGNLE